MGRIRRLFSRPAEGSSGRHYLPIMIGIGVILFAFLVAAPPIWEYTNSSGFCGTTCHTMPPEYTTYLVSPHARVLCVDCHIGRDLLIVQAYRKVGHLRLITDTILQNYEYPIRVSDMRPARETCELCHFPETFADDSLRVINTYDNNRTNDPYAIYLLMHTGGGDQRKGLALGIHWHVQNKISYIALDNEEQVIPWVRVETSDGKIVDYNSINSPVDTQNLSQYTLHTMDCITCHNRISHNLSTPAQSVDAALHSGDLSTDIPFIHTRAVELLTPAYPSAAAAYDAFATLNSYYQDNYPDFYAQGKAKVAQAITVLHKLYDENNFPDQVLNWQTHPNNIGHLNSPGCFRCHDGQHFSPDGKVIRLECNLCHSIPKVVRPGDIEPTLSIATGIEPTSHLDSTWIARHHNAFDATCSNCHTTGNPGGTDNSSFCSNSACHGNNWRYAGFNAPGLAAMLNIYQVKPVPVLEDFKGTPTYAVLQPMFAQVCGGCHGAVPTKGLRLTDYAGIMAGGQDGAVIVPGAPDKSLIVQMLTKGHFAKLSAHQMALLTQWIAEGAVEK